MNLNIALVITQKLDPTAGGVQRTTSKLAKIFKSNNHKVIILSIGNHESHREQYENITLYYINRKRTEELNYILIDESIDLIINQVGYSISLTKLILRHKATNTKLINTLRINPLNFYDNHKELVSFFFRRRKLNIFDNKISHKLILLYHIFKQRIELHNIIKNIDAFVMLSEYFKDELYFLAPGLKKHDHKIHGIGNPFEKPKIDLLKLDKENAILFVGRLNIIQKRVDILLEIWKKLHEQYPDWQFWVVGEGDAKGFMENFCKENKLDRVIFFGKDNPDKYYRKAKIFHMTSAFEGFGNVLVEAQSYGCVPVLFNTYSAAKDIVTSDINGILVKPFNIPDYIDQTKALISTPPHLKKLATNAFKSVKKFSYEKTYLKWDTVFKTITNNDKE